MPGASGVNADGTRGNLAVGMAVKLHPLVCEPSTLGLGIHERPVVGERDELVVDGRDMGLGCRPPTTAGRGIARVPDGDIARQMPERLLVEDLVDEPEVLMNEHRLAIAHGDAGALLPTMLQRLQAETREARDVFTRCIHTEHRTLLLKPIGALTRQDRGCHSPFPLRRWNTLPLPNPFWNRLITGEFPER